MSVILDKSAFFPVSGADFQKCHAVAILKRVLNRPIVLTTLLGCSPSILTCFGETKKISEQNFFRIKNIFSVILLLLDIFLEFFVPQSPFSIKKRYGCCFVSFVIHCRVSQNNLHFFQIWKRSIIFVFLSIFVHAVCGYICGFRELLWSGFVEPRYHHHQLQLRYNVAALQRGV